MDETTTFLYQEQLDAPFAISPDHIISYQQNGYIKLKNVLSPEVLLHYGQSIRDDVATKSRDALPLEQRTTYGMAFLQITNLWRQNETIKRFCFARRLGQIAAELMQVDGVRMYHDQALFKEPAGGFTPWHADQYYWPFSSNNCVTAWIPLQAVPLEMGPLSFCIGSQKILAYRDMAISEDSEIKIQTSLKDYPKDISAYDLGEVSFHAGWNFHRAGPNKTDTMRAVMTIIYMEDGMRLIEPQREAHQNDWDSWLPGATVGAKIDTPLNPIIYSRNSQ